MAEGKCKEHCTSLFSSRREHVDELVWGRGGEGTGLHLQRSSKTRSLF